MVRTGDNYVAVILEQIRDQNEAILEGNLHINEQLDRMATKTELAEVRQDVKVVKAAVTDVSKHLHNLARRPGLVETV